MRKKNQGFTLIELMIAIAVLSTMAGVLFQIFVVSRRIDAKARKEEVVLDAARGAMEELKAFSIDHWEQNVKKPEDVKGTVKIAGSSYEYEMLENSETDEGEQKGYIFRREFRASGTKEDENADYLIYTEADSGRYGKAEIPDGDSPSEEDIYSINSYRMPNIADVSSFQNIVVEPQMLIKDDAVWVEELLAKVNPAEEETSDAGDTAGEEEEAPEFTESDIKKYLLLNLKEITKGADDDNGMEEPGEPDAEKKDNGRLTATAESLYTVSSSTMSQSGGFTPEPEFTIRFPVSSYKKRIELDTKTDKPLNRIYLFLPQTSEVDFEEIHVTADLKKQYELYVILQNEPGISRADISIKDNGDGGIVLYTNLNDEKPVSLYEPENRLYSLAVTVYEADYENAGPDGKPVPGRELLKLDSAKSDE